MPDNEEKKDSKDSGSWEDDLTKLITPAKKEEKKEEAKEPEKKEEPEKKPTGPEKLPSADELETEWAEKIKQAKGDDKALLKEIQAERGKKAESLEDVFRQLKDKEAPAETRVAKPKGRLDKISGVVKGEAQEVKERELTGQGLPGVYKLYPMGTLPPLNLLSKAFRGLTKDTLPSDLKKANIPLYPDEYVSFAVGMGFMFAIIVFLAILFVMSPDLALSMMDIVIALGAFLLAFLLISFLLIQWPTLRLSSNSREIDRQLPYALRHMSALLSAGISIFDSIVSVSKANYGALSMEFDKIVWDVKSGENLSEALQDASDRMNSAAFLRVTIHIRRALQMGGDIAKIIGQIADDLTFEMRMKVSDFVEKLNAFAIVYLIGGIVGPVVVAVFTVVSSAGPMKQMGGGLVIDPSMLMFMVLLVFPMLMIIITYVVKLMEPKV